MARKRITERPLVFLDTETTGLDPSKHVILEVGAVKVSPSLEVIEEYTALINPDSYARYEVSPEALAVNGLNLEELRSVGLPAAKVAQDTAELLRGAVLVGHNVAFDWGFVQPFLRVYAELPSDMDYHKLDTASMIWPLVQSGVINAPKLTLAAEALGVPAWAAHKALGDARATFEVYKVLMQKLKFDLAA